MFVSCKNYISELSNNDIVLELTIDDEKYFIYRGLTLPFTVISEISRGNLHVLHERGYSLRDEWFTPSGLRQILDNIKNIHSMKNHDDSCFEIKIKPSAKIMNNVSLDRIFKVLEFRIEQDFEFVDIEITEDMSEDDIDLAFEEAHQELRDEYMSEFRTYFENIDPETEKAIRDKIYSLI